MKDMALNNLGSCAERVVESVINTDSPIEQMMFKEFMRNPNIIMCLKDEMFSKTGIAGCGIFAQAQVGVGAYSADFMIRVVGFDRSHKVWPPNVDVMFAVECDGKAYHSSPEQIEHDRRRDNFFKKQGLDTLRFSGAEIHHNAEYCVDGIVDYARNLIV